MSINVQRLVAALRWVEHAGVARTGGNSGHYEHVGTTETRYDFGDNRPIVCTYHPERGEGVGLSGMKSGEWTIDCPSPFRPDSERSRVVLPIAA